MLWFFRAVILAVLPASFLIYRSRLLTLTAFKYIKMHQSDREGLAYKKSIKILNYFFIFPTLRKMDYMAYISYKLMNRDRYEIRGETLSSIIMLLVVFFRLWNTEIEPFILPWEYLMLISMLLFQRQGVFLIKVTVFIPVSIIYAFTNCFCRRN